MDGTYHTELENDGSSLLVTVESADRLHLRLAIPWEQITEAVSQEVRARFVKGEVATHFVGSPRIGMHFSLRDLTESWIDRFDPGDEHSIAERDLLIGVFRDCLSRLEATATLE
jgi:uncharacterized protein (DUF58 family)